MNYDRQVLFIGPSIVGLEKFDTSTLNDYDFVARTNLYLESNNDRCDIIYLNKFAFNKYLEKNNFQSIEDKIVLVKFDHQKDTLKNILPNTEIASLQRERSEFSRQFHLESYSGTSLILYLCNNFKHVYVTGIDFYDSGIGKNAKYIDGYEAYNQRETEEPVHNMKKDLLFLSRLLKKKTNITFLGKTKEIYERLINNA